MAKILTQEASLLDKKRRMARESTALGRIYPIELGLGVLLTAYTLFTVFVSHKPAGALPYGAGLLIFLGIGHFVRIHENRRDQFNTTAGREGEQLVSRLLESGLGSSYYVINDATVLFGRKSAQIDHLVVGPTGVFVLETKNWRGRLEGDEKEHKWHQTREPGSKAIPLNNPIKQNQRHLEILGSFLKARGLADIPLISGVVMTNKSATWSVQNQTVPLIAPSDLTYFIATHPSPKTITADQQARILKEICGQSVAVEDPQLAMSTGLERKPS